MRVLTLASWSFSWLGFGFRAQPSNLKSLPPLPQVLSSRWQSQTASAGARSGVGVCCVVFLLVFGSCVFCAFFGHCARRRDGAVAHYLVDQIVRFVPTCWSVSPFRLAARVFGRSVGRALSSLVSSAAPAGNVVPGGYSHAVCGWPGPRRRFRDSRCCPSLLCCCR